MRNKKRMMSMGMATVMMISVLPAVSVGAEEGVTLSVIHAYTKEESEQGDNTRKMPRETILEFDEKRDDVTLEITEVQHDDYETKLQALAAANDLPDVFTMKGSWVGNFYKNGLLADMTEAVENCEWKDQYRFYLFDNVTMADGTIVGAPMQFSSTTIAYYNQALWDEAGLELPETWDDVWAAAEVFKEKGITPIAFGNADKWQYNSSWISAIGPRIAGEEWVDNIIAKNGNASFNDEEFVKVLEFTKELGASGALNPDYETIGNQDASAQFLQGNAAMFIDGYWNVEYTESNATDEMKENIVLKALPGFVDGKGDQTSITGGCGWFVGVNSKLEGEELEAALDLAMYASGPALSQRMTDVGLISTCETVAADPDSFPVTNQKFLDFVAEASSTVPIWDASIDASVIDVMNGQFVEVLAGTVEPVDAAATIQAEYEAVCAQ